MYEFVLASRSPRRQSLLRNLLDHFIVMDSDSEEKQIPGEQPAEYVLRVAREKAFSAGEKLGNHQYSEMLIIAADTIVVDQNQQLGKPDTPEDAEKILIGLRNKTHQVLSGLTLYQLSNRRVNTRVVRSDVLMRNYSDQEIQTYIASGDPFDKAGAYAIQNEDFNPAPDFEGCFANVMGLPLCHLAVMCGEAEVDVKPGFAQRCQVSINYQCSVYPAILSGDSEQ